MHVDLVTVLVTAKVGTYSCIPATPPNAAEWQWHNAVQTWLKSSAAPIKRHRIVFPCLLYLMYSQVTRGSLYESESTQPSIFARTTVPLRHRGLWSAVYTTCARR